MFTRSDSKNYTLSDYESGLFPIESNAGFGSESVSSATHTGLALCTPKPTGEAPLLSFGISGQVYFNDPSDSSSISIISGTEGHDRVFVRNDDDLFVSDVLTGGGDDWVVVGRNTFVYNLEMGDGDDTVTLNGDNSELGILSAGEGNDTLVIGDGGTAYNPSMGAGDDHLILEDGSMVYHFYGDAGNDTMDIEAGAHFHSLNGGQGDDTVNLDLNGSDGWSSFGVGGGDGCEVDGDTLNLTYAGNIVSVTYDEEKNYYYVTLDNGVTVSIKGFENINWPDGFDESIIEITGEPGPEVDDGEDAINALFFDEDTSQQMIEEQFAKSQDDDDQVGIDLFI